MAPETSLTIIHKPSMMDQLHSLSTAAQQAFRYHLLSLETTAQRALISGFCANLRLNHTLMIRLKPQSFCITIQDVRIKDISAPSRMPNECYIGGSKDSLFAGRYGKDDSPYQLSPVGGSGGAGDEPEKSPIDGSGNGGKENNDGNGDRDDAGGASAAAGNAPARFTGSWGGSGGGHRDSDKNVAHLLRRISERPVYTTLELRHGRDDRDNNARTMILHARSRQTLRVPAGIIEDHFERVNGPSRYGSSYNYCNSKGRKRDTNRRGTTVVHYGTGWREGAQDW